MCLPISLIYAFKAQLEIVSLKELCEFFVALSMTYFLETFSIFRIVLIESPVI